LEGKFVVSGQTAYQDKTDERRSWVRPAILQFSPGLVSWKHEKVEIAELQA